jgi:PAS domain S-box-containing protein
MNNDISSQDLMRDDTPLATVMNSIFDGVYIVDQDRKIIFWNRGAQSITGYSPEEVVGKCCKDDILNHIDENGILLCQNGCPLQKTLDTGEEIQIKVYALGKDGKRFPVKTNMAPIRNDNGETIAAIEVFRDISQEEEFRIMQEKFNGLIKRYVSTATMDKVMEHLHGIPAGEAQMRDMTVLYLDVVNFTGFSEQHNPEEIAKMLNDLFGICEVITKEYFGDIDKFIGDAIMAVFIDANDATTAGKKILESLQPFNQSRQEAGQEEIRIRIGINSGMLMHAEIGTSDRMDMTVIGDVVNAASRIESECEPMRMCISEATYSRLKEPELFQSYKTVSVKNRDEPVSMYINTEGC